jgi:hypothetical protein
MAAQGWWEKSRVHQALKRIVAGPGIAVDPANPSAPVISAKISTDVSNALSFGTDNGLFATSGGGSGTVTSVGVSTGTSGVGVTGSPITTSGTIDLDLGTMADVDDAPSDGTTYGRNNAAWVATGGGSSVQSPGCVFSNGNLLLTGTLTSEIQVPYGGTIEAWTIAGDAAGDASIIVSHATYAAYPTMTTLFTATCTGSAKAQATGITHTLTAGDILRFSGSGFLLFTRVSITLEVN